MAYPLVGKVVAGAAALAKPPSAKAIYGLKTPIIFYFLSPPPAYNAS
jgi:hypothetical protein